MANSIRSRGVSFASHLGPSVDEEVFKTATMMTDRRNNAPHLFLPNGSYKRFVHFFCVQRDRSGASVNANSHFSLPWELDEELGPETFEALTAHYNLHGMRVWQINWALTWSSIARSMLNRAGTKNVLGHLAHDFMSNPAFWMLLPGLLLLSRVRRT